MELKSNAFKIAVERLLHANTKLIGAITAPIYGHRVPFCDEIAARSGVTVLKLLKRTRDEIASNVVKKLLSTWVPQVSPAVPTKAAHKPVLELYFKTISDIPELVNRAVLPTHEAICGIGGVLATFKCAKDASSNPKACKLLRKLLPLSIKIHAVWSSKFVKEKSIEDYSQCLDAYTRDIKASGGSSVLVVSGTGKRKSANALTILQRDAPNWNIGIAYNPFIGCRFDPDEKTRDARRREELSRLTAKLEQSSCTSVWLQFGVDIDALERGLDDLERILGGLSRHVDVYGSIFVPSKHG